MPNQHRRGPSATLRGCDFLISLVVRGRKAPRSIRPAASPGSFGYSSEAVTFLISLVVRGRKAPRSICPTSIAGVLRLRAISL